TIAADSARLAIDGAEESGGVTASSACSSGDAVLRESAAGDCGPGPGIVVDRTARAAASSLRRISKQWTGVTADALAAGGVVAGKSRVGDGERTAVVEDGATMAGSSGRFGIRGEDGSEDRASTAHLVVGKDAAIHDESAAVVDGTTLAGRRRKTIGAE